VRAPAIALLILLWATTTCGSCKPMAGHEGTKNDNAMNGGAPSEDSLQARLGEDLGALARLMEASPDRDVARKLAELDADWSRQGAYYGEFLRRLRPMLQRPAPAWEAGFLHGALSRAGEVGILEGFYLLDWAEDVAGLNAHDPRGRDTWAAAKATLMARRVAAMAALFDPQRLPELNVSPPDQGLPPGADPQAGADPAAREAHAEAVRKAADYGRYYAFQAALRRLPQEYPRVFE
jgi:hypothetical protein